MSESTLASPSAPRPGSTWEDLVDIFYAPSRVFARRPAGAFWLPLIVLVVVMVLIFYATRDLLQPLMDAEFKRSAAAVLKANPQLTPEQLERGRSMGRTFGGIGLGLTMLIGPLLTGLLLWLVGKLFDAKQALGAALVVGTFAFYPRIIQGIVNGVQAFLMPEGSLNSQYAISVGPARFLDAAAASPWLLMVLGRLDLFTIWVTILLAIGLHVTGRISMGRALMASAVVWVVGFLPLIPGVARTAA